MKYHDLPLALEQRLERTAALAVNMYEANSHLQARHIRQRPGSCMKIAVIQHMLLRELGTDTFFMRSGHPRLPHIFLGYQDPYVDRTGCDPTWQQFLAQGNTQNNPETLLFSMGKVAQRLGSLAIAEECTSVWTDAREGPIDLPTVLGFSPQLENIFRQRGWPQDSLNQQTKVSYY